MLSLMKLPRLAGFPNVMHMTISLSCIYDIM